MQLKKSFFYLLLLLCYATGYTQVENEVAPPFNIKTVAFVQNNNVMIPMFRLGDPFELQFDDLYGNEEDYYYTITQYNYDWTPTQLAKAEYLQGMDDQRIMTYENSFNTLQIFSHYTLTFPNRFNRIKLSGNYMVKVFNSDRDLVFSRKFILYEEQVSVPLQIKRSRDLNTIYGMQNLDFTIKMGDNILQNPIQNVKVVLFQNGRFDNAIYNIKPQYTLGSDLIYKYNKETQFWGGNEFLFYENKDIRGLGNNVLQITSGEIYNTHLYMNTARANNPYTYFPDINGSYLIHKINAEKNALEADYSWVYFTLSANTFLNGKDIYVTGMFNNFALTPEYKLDYNAEKGLFEKAVLMKQGFVNYQYVIADKNGKADYENAVDGNFYQTENNYFVLVYYRGNSERYDRVIGRGIANSENITN
ncbi:type IX secretion system plug protein [Flavobacterium pedocola]